MTTAGKIGTVLLLAAGLAAFIFAGVFPMVQKNRAEERQAALLAEEEAANTRAEQLAYDRAQREADSARFEVLLQGDDGGFRTVCNATAIDREDAVFTIETAPNCVAADVTDLWVMAVGEGMPRVVQRAEIAARLPGDVGDRLHLTASLPDIQHLVATRPRHTQATGAVTP